MTHYAKSDVFPTIYGGVETRTIDTKIKVASAREDLDAVPIDECWILEGSPVARIKLMSGSSDGISNTYIWDCTAGRFNWKYSCDETVCVLDGSAMVKNEDGELHTLQPGDTMFFPAGSNADWTVLQYVRKVAIMRNPVYRPLATLLRIYFKLKRLIRGQASPSGFAAGA